MKLSADNNVKPIRNQIIELTERNSRVIEFGCGNGELLLELSPKIKSGLGIDKSNYQIDKALKKKRRLNIQNISFENRVLGRDFETSVRYDTSIAILFFHTVSITDSVYLINKMKEISENVLICGFSKPRSFYHKSLLWIDQKITNHYKKFITYQKSGYLHGILEKAHISTYKIYDTAIPFVKVYKF